MSYDIFGIVDHSNLFDERNGPKNTDHTISFVTDYWQQFHAAIPWAQRLAIYLDNATSTNKNKYLFSWAMEMVGSRFAEHIHISFMVAGHTKFAPDRLFSITGCAYKTADVFCTEDLKTICEQAGVTFTIEGVSAKYSSLPGVRKLHDFLIVRSNTDQVVMKVREKIFSGAWSYTYSTIHIHK